MGSSKNKIDILLVDDRPADLLVLKSILSISGYELVTASSGQEALRHLLERDFAVIVLDVFMPEMDGLELATLIRQRERSAYTPILFLTGAGSDVHFIYQAYAVGAVDYLTKPVSPEILRAKVEVFVELYKKDLRIQEQASILVDVVKRNQELELEQVRAENTRRYRNLADSISHVVWTTDTRGHVTFFNRQWIEYTGLSLPLAESESNGKTHDSSWLEAVHPDEQERCAKRWARSLVEKHAFETHCRLRRFDGTYRWHLCRALPEINSEGTTDGWIGTHTDVDDLLRARMIAENSRRRLEYLAEVGAMLAGALDVKDGLLAFAQHTVPRVADGCVLRVWDGIGPSRTILCDVIVHRDVKQKELLSRVIECFCGSAVQNFVTHDRSAFVGPLDEATIKRLTPDEDSQARVKALGIRSVMIVPIAARGRYLGWIAFVSNASDRLYGDDDLAIGLMVGRRAGIAVDNALLRNESERAIQVRDEFLSVASHELRTPLSALLLQLESLTRILRDRTPTEWAHDGKLPKKVMAALRHTHRLTKLVDNLLDVSRLTTKCLHLELEEFDLAAILRDVADRFAEEANQAQCQFVVSGDGECVGRWDRLRIEQVLTNLISNALKYSRGTPIELGLQSDCANVSISVRDHGIGILSEDQGRIFDRFERAASVRHYGGLGLGLYIARQIVVAHEGSIRVASEQGQGTMFTVVLPRRMPLSSKEPLRLPKAEEAQQEAITTITAPKIDAQIEVCAGR